MDLSNFLPGFVVDYGPNVLMYLGGAIAGLAIVSPLTKSNVDNKILDVLRWVVMFGGKAVGAPQAPKKGTVRDHRNSRGK